MKTSPQYITRIDQPAKKTLGWYAKFTYGAEKYSKLFSDKKNGGKDQAFIAAQKWVSETRKGLSLKYGENTNTTGFPGIYELKAQNRIIAVWKTPEGKTGQTSRSLTNNKRKDAIRELVEIQRQKNRGE